MWVIKHKKDFSLLSRVIEDPNNLRGDNIELPYLFATEKVAKSFLKTRHRAKQLNKKDYEIIYQGGK